MSFRSILLFCGSAGMLLGQGEYGGPSILSRGTIPSNRQENAPVIFRPYLYLNGIYDTGLTGVSVDRNGKLTSDDVFGGEAGLGAYGYHQWKRTMVGLDYRGNFRHYSRRNYYDGSDHVLNLDVSHQVRRHVTLNLRESAGTFSRNFGLLMGPGYFDPIYSQIPFNELFDNRTNYVSTQADVIWQKSARLSLDGGADGFLVRRQSSALYGVTGYAVRGDIAYRLSRHTTIGLEYRFTHFEFTKAFGASDMHILGVNYAVRLSRTWEVALRVGGGRVESLMATLVAIDPVVAAITGQTVGLRADYRVNYAPSLGVRLSRIMKRATLQLGYDRGVTPGNGLLLTSRTESFTGNYSYTGVRRWNLGINAGYSSMGSLTGLPGSYHGAYGGIGATRQLGKNFHAMLRYDARRYNMMSVRDFNRFMYRATIGVAFSPGDTPLNLW